MERIRVAFLLGLSNSWIGGINYFRNLLHLINENKSYNIEPVIFIADNADINLLKGYPKVEIVKTELLNGNSFYNKFNRGAKKFFHKTFFWKDVLKKYKIDVVSHITGTMYLKGFPVIGWIPDFQHKHLPKFFSQKELISRDKDFGKMAMNYDCIILSSNDAENDFEKYFLDYIYKAKVFQFVVFPENVKYDKKKLLEKYNIKGNFFYIPNQFWQHKNHKLVLEALKILLPTDIKVYCSGNIHDYRNKEYFNELLEYINKYNLGNNFIILGQIPYEDVQGLMLETKALINPSLFEGWSTSVEEAKSLGKRIILSDINVHKEQNPSGGEFFSKNNAKDLAEIMKNVWNEDDLISNNLSELAKNDLEKRKKTAIEKYREILEFTLKTYKQK